MTVNHTAPGVVQVRLSGSADDIEPVAALLRQWTLIRRGPYPNRKDPGERVYLTVQLPASPS